MDKDSKHEEVKTAAELAWEKAQKAGQGAQAPRGKADPAAPAAAGQAAGRPGDDLQGAPHHKAEGHSRQAAAPGDKSAEYLEDLRRLKAEFENYKKRMVREQTNFLALANKDLMEKLLPVMDDLDRAVAVSEETKDFDKLAEGVHLIRSQMVKVLEAEGLEVINPLGKEFDPTHSEAVLKVESPEHDEHTVVEVLQKGYRLKGRLIRPAMVKVSGKSS